MDSRKEETDSRVVFLPSEEIRCLERTLDKLKQARQEFQKAAEEIKPPGNEDLNR